MKKISKLGIFDSGLGGYTVYQDLKEHFPKLSTTLYADQKHAPYGNYDNETITALAINAMKWFEDNDIKDVLLACNTVTSVALDILKERYPNMRIWGIIDLTISQLPKDTKTVGVVATSATINAHAYQKALESSFEGINVIELPLKNLANAIESLAKDEDVDRMIEKPLEDMSDAEYIILGCTHYPLVKNRFEHYSKSKFIDSILPIREFIGHNYLETDIESHIVTTKDAEEFKNQIRTLYRVEEKVEKV
ncbi:MAG: glutamate racemase [Erysipelothrix sp.]|nr:glutamate racemase [Erysipelothrix sp.]